MRRSFVWFYVSTAAMFGFIFSTTPTLASYPSSVLSRDNLPHTAAAYPSSCANPPNPIVAENCLPGSDGWILTQPSDLISLYASQDSMNIGDNLDLFINTAGAAYSLEIYRNGYYGGLGGRLIQKVDDLPGQSQPACDRMDDDTGLATCSRWSASYSLTIPAEWVSGIYIAKITLGDNGNQGYTVFVVRDDQRDSDILYQQSVTTFHAYNQYGGKSVYSHISSICPTVAEAPRAVKVSLNRPYYQPQTIPNMYFRAEYPMVRWLEAQGYDVTYSTSLDTHRSGKPGAHNELLDHKTFLDVGHDEYWSQEMHDAITAARDAGVNIGFFTSNTSYWRIRFEPDPLTGEPDSVMVTYKTTESGPPDPSGTPTTTWRDPAGANAPENGLTGVMYVGDNDSIFFPLRVTADHASDRIYRHTSLENMPPDTYADIGHQIVGWEWDSVVDNGHTPDGLTILADTPVYGELLNDAGNHVNSSLKPAVVNTTRYIAPSGAIVFATGTIQWSWGLGANGLDAVDPDSYISQITYNVLADMDAQPATPSDGLVLDGDSMRPEHPQPEFLSLKDAQPPVISNLQAAVDGDSVKITWNTDVEATGQLWFGERAGYVSDSKGSNIGYSTQHSFTVSGLDANYKYFFKVVSVGRNWQIAISEENQFATDSISLTHQLVDTAMPVIQSVGCWVKTNPSESMPFAIVGFAIGAFLIWRSAVTIWDRKGRLKRI
ncbi:MAG: fibronectin type III domain-containing protein [Chloroflexota bacterium]